jgi:hypothetical protein
MLLFSIYISNNYFQVENISSNSIITGNAITGNLTINGDMILTNYATIGISLLCMRRLQADDLFIMKILKP